MRFRSLVLSVLLCLCLAGNALAQSVDAMGPLELRSLIDASTGRVLVINYWATWCNPCVQEMPGLMALRQKFSETDLQIVGISVDYDANTVSRFVDSRGINFPIYIDNGDISSMLGVSSIPRTMVYDRKGKKVLDHVGLIDEENFDHIVQRVLEMQ